MMNSRKFIAIVEADINRDIQTDADTPLYISSIKPNFIHQYENHGFAFGIFEIEAWAIERDSSGLALYPKRMRISIRADMLASILERDLRESGLSLEEHIEALLSGTDIRLLGDATRHGIDNDLIESLFGGAA